MSEAPRILKTEDGSATLYLESLRETYHSIHGALSESLHVYIKNGLNLVKDKLEHINILEVGFGTGLNTLLTLDHMRPGQSVNYCALEPFPLSQELLKAYYEGFGEKPKSLNLLDGLCKAPQGELTSITQGFNFSLLKTTLQELGPADAGGKPFDLVYYDAFAPSKQPEMWSLETLKKATERMSPGAVLTTYCAQGQFKRYLKELGLIVENPPGANGKREMTVASYKLQITSYK